MIQSQRKKALYVNSRNTVQRELRQMQEVLYSKKADEIQSYADSNNMKDFYASLKSVYGPQPSGSSPLLSSDGNSIITDRSKILDRWAEHFQAVLNRPSNINDEAINRLKQTPINIALADPPQPSEVKKRYQSSLVAKHLAKIAYQQKYMPQVAPSLSTSSLNFSVKCGIKREFPKSSRMPQLSTFTRRKGTGSPVTTTVEYPSCP